MHEGTHVDDYVSLKQAQYSIEQLIRETLAWIPPDGLVRSIIPVEFVDDGSLFRIISILRSTQLDDGLPFMWWMFHVEENAFEESGVHE